MALAIALFSGACGRVAPAASLDVDAREYVRLAVALGERDPDSLDFYVGPDEAVADIRRNPPPLQSIAREAGALAARLSQRTMRPGDAPRVLALAADLAAMIARVDLLTGTRLPYDKESIAFFGVTPERSDQARTAGIRSRIAAIVGSGASLADRYTVFASRFVVPAERLPDVMRAALAACRGATIGRVALPPGEQVTLEFVRNKPWSAFSRYRGDARSTIQINTDFTFTVDQTLQVACHEGYPGHHTRNTLAAPRRDAVGSPPERSIQLMFTPEALWSEAAAMLAADVAFTPDARRRVETERLFPLAGLSRDAAASHIELERLVSELQTVQADVARRYLDGQLEFARAVVELQDRALVPHAEALVKYINQYRSYVTTYTAGPRLLAARLAWCGGGAPTDDIRWRCYESETLSRR